MMLIELHIYFYIILYFTHVLYHYFLVCYGAAALPNDEAKDITVLYCHFWSLSQSQRGILDTRHKHQNRARGSVTHHGQKKRASQG